MGSRTTEQNDQREVWNNVAPAILIPPNPSNPHQGWKALVLSRTSPERIYFGTKCLPGKITGTCTDQIQEKESITGFLIQITNADQYIYLRSAKGKALVFEAFSGEISITQNLTKEKKILLPGEEVKVDLGLPLYLTEITFSMHEIKDQEIVDRVVDTVWKRKL